MHRLAPCAPIHLLSSRCCSSVFRFSDFVMTPLVGSVDENAMTPLHEAVRAVKLGEDRGDEAYIVYRICTYQLLVRNYSIS